MGLILLVNVGCKNPKSMEFANTLAIFLSGAGASLRPIQEEPATSTSTTYQPIDYAASLPADFGDGLPRAFVNINTIVNVNRYKSIEIQFSVSMNKTTVESNFSIVCDGTSLRGPSQGGTFFWASSRRLIFDPYTELPAKAECTIAITTGAKAKSGVPLVGDYSFSFKTAPDYIINTTINEKPLNIDDDVTFDKTTYPSLILKSSFPNPIGDYVKSIVLKKLGSEASFSVCEPCVFQDLFTNFNLLTISENGLLPHEGGNTYYFVIEEEFDNGLEGENKLTINRTYKRYFSFNYGNTINPNNMMTNAASAVLDEGKVMKFLGKIVEKFTANDFKVNGKTFQDFLQGEIPKTSHRGSETPCFQWAGSDTLPFSFIPGYGHKPGDYGYGYCWNTTDPY